MTPEDLKHARRSLGLTVAEFADELGVSPLQVRRMEMQPGKSSWRPIMPETEERIRALLRRYPTGPPDD